MTTKKPADAEDWQVITPEEFEELDEKLRRELRDADLAAATVHLRGRGPITFEWRSEDVRDHFTTPLDIDDVREDLRDLTEDEQ
jgi:hypothetical protein